MDLCVNVYKLAQRLPPEERFRLVDQILRSASSVPANIAEGYYRSSRKEYAHFVATAKGSLMELETHIELARRLGFIDDPSARSVINDIEPISKMLTSLRNRLLERA